MNPDSPETRLLRLEERTARLDQRVEDLGREVNALVPLVRELGEVVVELRGVKSDVTEVRNEVTAVRMAIDDRDKTATAERRQNRNAMLALTGVIIAAIITAIGTIIAAGFPS